MAQTIRHENDLDQQLIMNLTVKMEAMVKDADQQGHGQEAVVALASALQGVLSCDMNYKYPESGAIEVIMRSVMAILKGISDDEGQQSYVLGKFRVGLGMLGFKVTEF